MRQSTEVNGYIEAKEDLGNPWADVRVEPSPQSSESLEV
jgi:hypothetical protein